MANTTDKMTLYTFAGSQWAGVPHLTLAEKGFKRSDYELKEIDLFQAENFDPAYLAINPNGTIPSLKAPDLKTSLIDSRDILSYLNTHSSTGPNLLPTDTTTQQKIQQIIDFAHSDQVNTDLILLHARSKSEMEAKQLSPWKDFVLDRQNALEKYEKEFPGHEFYGPKVLSNGSVATLYTSEIGSQHDAFFTLSTQMYKDFAAGVKELDELLVLPYAAGEEVTAADLHLVPWLSHALWGAGATSIEDFETLEKLIGETVSGFVVGERVKGWWGRIGQRESFREVYAELH